ncbi:MAG: tRNA (adenosine(37)-N6)-dimethylallyltransferase MiaA [Oscillatoriaceae bacterium SKW80]|nr:tRNA (adenosine(37)-N6)-dimethylallyltransferase MiaA [Oscillatoriaceae bacterium SKYG93]MCX8121468.1 tRNA (adenosine(37)-N6)-dimethylallyltransferase MiaA [Oscillatoriaceae bacterium SKW80]MDW8452946.1 tRNA (adenosine(37)-N6)-dimethylallyltransferase MiaA [Oscillatoriaceae cyanobacterium SKYGB_i_bin93]HIK27816.1 tRNA (adenosine(37)-N6)-dimethylallyltransferase MiaA [Oscillatoriaceae cyanobacterium M7585_C2015_266]
MHPTNFQPALVAICGPTATGKSGLAIALAQRLGSVILSADSRQVYREFDIGTAKPSQTERLLVPHYLIDICEPTETLTVADYQQQAQTLITSFSLSLFSPPILLVGGTGLYLKAVLRGLKIPKVAPQPQLRSQLSSLGQSQCYTMLQQVDPVAAQKIHPHDSVRTLRALEVYYITGRPISELQGENPPNYPILQIGLDCSDTNKLRARIARRTEQMLAAGWLAEVEYLLEKYGASLPLMNTLGYQEMAQYLAGKITLAEAKELTILHTRQFAKRQRTWFRAVSNIEWFDADNPDLLELVWQRVQEFLQKRSLTI